MRNRTFPVREFLLVAALGVPIGASGDSCDTPYAEHGVYDTTILYTIDEIVDGPLFLDMDVDRNTYEYRADAYRYFAEQFGIEFDPSRDGIQEVRDESGAVASVYPLKTGAGSTHQVYAVDAQDIRQWRGRMPLTDVALFDDGFFVTLLDDFVVNGEFGGFEGVELPAFTQLVFGEYRMFDGRGELLDTLRYRSDIPVAGVPVSGSFAGSGGGTFLTIACEIDSDVFGSGNVRALAEITDLGGGQTRLDFRYVMRFPSRLDLSTRDRSHCDRLPPVRRRPH